jgi:TRAP-type transport system periplasmic protein
MVAPRMATAAGACIAALMLLLGASSGAAAAGSKTYLMKITLATENDSLYQFARNYAAALEKDSAGRIKAEIYPGSRLGSIQRQIEGVQFGSIQCAVIPPEFYVGIDERFEVLAAPGLVDSMQQGQRVAADPAVLKLMLGLGAGKGLHGVALFMGTPAAIVSRSPIRHLADFKGKKIRIFGSQFQSVAMRRLGAIPKPMTLSDVLPALQDNALDGALAALNAFVPMHFQTAAKYVTQTDQSAIFVMVEVSRTWYESLPPDLRQIVDRDAAAESVAINPVAIDFLANAAKQWVAGGGELIKLPPDEQASMLRILASVGDEVAATKPALNAAYKIVTDAAERSR